MESSSLQQASTRHDGIQARVEGGGRARAGFGQRHVVVGEAGRGRYVWAAGRVRASNVTRLIGAERLVVGAWWVPVRDAAGDCPRLATMSDSPCSAVAAVRGQKRPTRQTRL